AALAHLGFKKMMPNDRGIELLRFGGEEHAISVARAVERLELALPEKHRPTGHSATRLKMIGNWQRPMDRKSARAARPVSACPVKSWPLIVRQQACRSWPYRAAHRRTPG